MKKSKPKIIFFPTLTVSVFKPEKFKPESDYVNFEILF